MGSFHDMPKHSPRLWPPPPIGWNHEVLMWPVSDENLKPNYLRPEIAQARKTFKGDRKRKTLS
jgi:hypothetical protein